MATIDGGPVRHYTAWESFVDWLREPWTLCKFGLHDDGPVWLEHRKALTVVGMPVDVAVRYRRCVECQRVREIGTVILR